MNIKTGVVTFLFIIMFWGCGGSGGGTTSTPTTTTTTSTTTTSTTTTSTTSKSVTVSATSSWKDSGVTLSGGETVCVTASASWKPDPQQATVDAMGRPSLCTSSPCPIPTANSGALVGRIGSNTPFIVGSNFKFSTTQSGTLQFMINDDVNILNDNSGSASVQVQIGECSISTSSVSSGVTISATSSWTDSGVTLAGGETVCVTATASWKPDPQQVTVDAMGRPSLCNSASCPISAINSGALVGRVGTNSPFVVGNSFKFSNSQSGKLQLMINDDTNILGDNSGSATVSVQVGC